ncbi:MAG: VCBS repeat-containing protein [Armatimonadetes bacterium]|nr:VCBS repeat-containing protein [Armatimonadota bacterium]
MPDTRRLFALLLCALPLAAAETVTPLPAFRPLYLDTPLARDGRPAIVAVDDAVLRPAAERLAAAVKARLGVDLELRTNATAELLAERDVIALGNVNNNAVIKRLYSMRLCYLDALYPGKAEATGGFDLSRDQTTPTGWSFSTPTGPTHTVTLDKLTARSRPYSVRIDGTKEPDARGCVLRNLPVNPGTTCKVSFWYKGKWEADGYGYALVDAYRDQTRIAQQDHKLTASEDWQEATLTLAVPAEANLVRCLLYLHGKGTVWYDDVQVLDAAGTDLLRGGDGWVVHTVHNPLGTGHNAVVAGGSTPAGHAAAVDALIERINGLPAPVLPRLLLVQPGDSAVNAGLLPAGPDEPGIERLRQSTRKTLDTNAYVPVRDTFQATLSWARNYQLTGDERHARACRAVWRELLDSKASNTHREMEWIFRAMEAWDLAEEAPVFSDAERLEITQRLLDIGCANETAYGPSVRNTNRLIAEGHQLDQALCLWLHGLYYDRYYHLNGHWMTLAQPLIDLAEETPRVHDSYAYGPIAGNDFMTEYALKSGRTGYYDKGSCKALAEWVMLCSDNLGAGGTFGDDGAWRGEVPTTLLAKAWGWYGDARYLWFLRGVRPPVGCFATDALPKPPVDLLGAVALPLHERLYQTAVGAGADPAAKAWSADLVPPGKAFDKLAFRTGFKPEDQYLLVDGLSVIPHGHRDGGSILRFTDNGRLFLTEGHYIEIAPERHNTLTVNREGETWSPPPLTSMENCASFPHACLARIVTSAYNGVDWSRSILQNTERFFVVMDTVTARQAGDYAFTLHWQTLGDARLEGGLLTADQAGQSFCIQNVDGAVCRLREKVHQLGGNYYAQYPYSGDGLVKHLTQTRVVHLAEGASTTFLNLLTTQKTGDAPLRAVRLAETAVRVEGTGGPWLAGSGRQSTALAEIDGDLWMVGSDGATIAGTRRLNAGLAVVECRPPLDADLDLNTGEVTIAAKVDAEVDLVMPDGTKTTMPFPAGRQTLPSPTQRDPTPEIAALPAHPAEPLPEPAALEAKGLAVAHEIPLPHAAQDAATDAPAPQGVTRWASSSGTAAVAADVDRDGNQELVVGTRTGEVLVCRLDGKVLWRVPVEGAVTALAAGDVDGDRRPEILCGTDGARLYCFGPDGKERWHHDFAVFWGRRGNVRCVAVADLDGDRRPEVVVGTESWHYWCSDGAGKEKWSHEILHGATDVTVADLDGDGKAEVLAGHEYYGPACLDANGETRFAVYGSGPWCTRTAAWDANHDGKPEAVFALEDNQLHVRDAKGQAVLDVNVGGWVSDLAAADLDGDGQSELVAGALTSWRNLVAVAGDGQRRWSLTLPGQVTAGAARRTSAEAGAGVAGEGAAAHAGRHVGRRAARAGGAMTPTAAPGAAGSPRRTGPRRRSSAAPRCSAACRRG